MCASMSRVFSWLLFATDVDAGVLAMTSTDFDSVLESNERVLVDFFAPWCGHCKQLEPEYARAAERAKSSGLKCLLASVDVSVEVKLSKRFNVKSFPVLHYFVNGHVKATLPDEVRTSDALYTWLRNKEMPPIREFVEASEGEFLQMPVGQSVPSETNTEFRFLAHVKKNSARSKAYFTAVSEHLLEIKWANLSFGIVWLPTAADAKADAKLLMFRPTFRDPDAKLLEYTGAWSAGNLAKWVMKGTYATVGSGFDVAKYGLSAMELLSFEAAVVVLTNGVQSESSRSRGFEGNLTVGTNSSNNSLELRMIETLIPIAQQYAPHWRFTIANVQHLKFSDFEMLGGRKGATQLSVITGDKKFIMNDIDGIGATEIRSFLADVKSGKARPYYKSAPPPSSELEDGVLVLTGDTFDRHVLDATKDVFVDFYAPWCSHCKMLEPEFKALARQATDFGWVRRGVVIAKLDVTVNDCAEEVVSYPKLVLYPAVPVGRKFRVKQVYGGKREATAMIDFLTENAVKLDGADEDGAGSATKAQQKKSAHEMRSDL